MKKEEIISEKYIANNASATRHVVFVNGPPAAGKSSVAEKLAHIMKAPLLSLDTVKEALFDSLGNGDREYNRKMGRASMDVIWSVVGCMPAGSTVVIDAWLKYPPYDDLIHALHSAEVKNIVEIWCWARGEILAQRYRERVKLRHPGHLGEEYAEELKSVADRVAPTRLGPLVEIDTSDGNMEDNSNELFEWVVSELGLD